jgi:two-component system, LytTR family, response regulator
MMLNCLIVDDEPIARELLTTYIAQVPYLNLAGSCSDAFEAMAMLNKTNIDLLILDINMPRLSGFEMLRSLPRYPAVIITSAYPEYALEGFELSVTDYLLKPFSFPRFVQATEKVLNKQQPVVAAGAIGASSEQADFLMVKSDKKLTKIFFKEMLYVEAYGNYIYIHRKGERIISKQTLTQFESQLPSSQFVRIHKSYIVAVKAVQFIEGNEVALEGKRLPIGKVFKENLLKRFQ